MIVSRAKALPEPRPPQKRTFGSVLEWYSNCLGVGSYRTFKVPSGLVTVSALLMVILWWDWLDVNHGWEFFGLVHPPKSNPNIDGWTTFRLYLPRTID
jgi:hypothetical protein